ncbi:energy transducer TonB [Acetobacterium paludosum]|uniref:Energy transducer TonB n=1 Tax=Acetobacterium paludosum TaxID=52693 RepID=A0A923KXE0_9FIRM|nr:energy transducer TonB [Acetobacterium paludosum]MBC3888216.1 energy transducer TonB [Acetobacterium paludosum]
MTIKKGSMVFVWICILVLALGISGCSKQQSATSNNKTSSQKEATESSETKDYGTPDALGRVGYHCDIEADKKNFNGKVDIVVGDNLYTTQINDWYTNFDQYEGKTVEIEGYYINKYAPCTFVGRYGPSCPYCNGGYVSFEFYTQEDLSDLKPVQDWIKVIGILRQGEDKTGVFKYIEVLSLEKMDEVGMSTVTN